MGDGTAGGAEVLVLGGGVAGSFTALWLAGHMPGADIRVLEGDPGGSVASTGKALGGVRRQFSLRENRLLSGRSWHLFHHREEWQAPGDDDDLGLRENGYLFMLSDAQEPGFRRMHEALEREGTPCELLPGDRVHTIVPGLTTGSRWASYTPNDGSVDPSRTWAAARRAAQGHGVAWTTANVTALEPAGASVRVLTDGGTWTASAVVVACGPRSGAVLEASGVSLPVVPWRRITFTVRGGAGLPKLCPLTVWPSGLHFRREPSGEIVIGGPTEADAPNVPLEVDRQILERDFLPDLARDIPDLWPLAAPRGWAGYYDENTWDHTALIGACPDAPRVWVITGFSGHGVMQAPAAAEAVARAVVGRPAPEDAELAALSPCRIARDVRLEEVTDL